MKPHRVRMAHDLLLKYDVINQLEVRFPGNSSPWAAPAGLHTWTLLFHGLARSAGRAGAACCVGRSVCAHGSAHLASRVPARAGVLRRASSWTTGNAWGGLAFSAFLSQRANPWLGISPGAVDCGGDDILSHGRVRGVLAPHHAR